jgi:hypothetical protein
MGRCIAGGYGMTREDVIRMAREAGLDPDLWNYTDAFERFAALVAAAEREKVARWHIGSGYTTGHGDTIEDLLVELEWQVRESEREACAKVCEDRERANLYGVKECAAAIRARGNT